MVLIFHVVPICRGVFCKHSAHLYKVQNHVVQCSLVDKACGCHGLGVQFPVGSQKCTHVTVRSLLGKNHLQTACMPILLLYLLHEHGL